MCVYKFTCICAYICVYVHTCAYIFTFMQPIYKLHLYTKASKRVKETMCEGNYNIIK